MAYIQTVLGPIQSFELGITLAHEHLLVTNPNFQEPPSSKDTERAYAPLALHNLGWIRRNWTSNLDNMELADLAIAIEEVAEYQMAGGSGIIDPTLSTIGRNPEGLANISKATGVHIVMGSGYYVAATHPESIADRSEDEIIAELVHELEVGVMPARVRPGFIGEIGCSWPLTQGEIKVLRAAARAAAETGAALMVHPGRSAKAPWEIIDIVGDVGVDFRRLIFAHIERTIQNTQGLLDLAVTGCYLEFDLFGLESSYYPPSPEIDIPSDAQRIGQIQELLQAHLSQQLLLSHDICTKHRLAKYGGHGYSHLLRDIVPHMKSRGVSDAHISTMMVDNPAKAMALP